MSPPTTCPRSVKLPFPSLNNLDFGHLYNRITNRRIILLYDSTKRFNVSYERHTMQARLTLKLPRQSNGLVLQFYFKISTLCYIFSRNDVMNFATITKEII